MYTLEDYNKMMVSSQYTLPESIQMIIENLDIEIETKTVESLYNKTAYPVKKINKYSKAYEQPISNRIKKSNSNHRIITDKDWEMATKPVVFKVTEIEKKEGTDKKINDIRLSLNKITSKNYETHKNTIIELLSSIKLEDENNIDDALLVVSNALFDIIINNKFYSDMYASLCIELSTHFNVFLQLIDGFIEKYRKMLGEIQPMVKTDDYESQCDYNKQNDKRRAMTTFVVNLMIKGAIQKDVIGTLLSGMLDDILTNIELENQTSLIEELTENINIMVTMSYEDCKDVDNWKLVEEKIRQLSVIKTKEKKSYPSRSLFKYQDMIRGIEKEREKEKQK